MMLINGVATSQLAADDRGLAFGDGVFRTLECRHARPCLWDWHWACLQRDAAQLGLPLPDASVLLAELALVAAGLPRAVAKITLTRGSAPRGYAIPADPVPTRIVAARGWGGYPEHWGRDGVALGWSEVRLGLQPLLAGVKHLNRLENVLARSRMAAEVQEALLCDSEGTVVEGTQTNLFVRLDGHWLTPALDRCGVAGAVRSWMMAQQPVQEVRLMPAQLARAELLVLGNSLAGLWPVASLDGRQWSDFALLRPLQQALARDSAPQTP
ncbi:MULTISPECIES: aminodeoxychorismate lyase [unclassified Paludibacterium]|uniref:aminodeoxychorismate lyase n=1 Tax=unclassified Paludibacterium TaxID=2618429 RepID=UPI001C05AA11|nr:aminodeoxychorismate lyase [Paludibacterium sp. B53371]BEV71842.1 aminodeoxychorismate lyase [Paludibacterium sp. THUN1379]